jgi:hypothetical protein
MDSSPDELKKKPAKKAGFENGSAMLYLSFLGSKDLC